MASDENEVSSTKYDIVVFGATGFTGQFVVQELAKTIDEEGGLTWAVAGRNMKRLQEVLAKAGTKTGKNLEDLPIIIADISSENSLMEMCQQARVVLNTVGPYSFYGNQVVKACIEKGASHLDVSGEPQFLEKMQLLYHTTAKEKSVYIVGACGFDSVPSDMGVLFTKEKFPGELNSVEGYLSIKSGSAGAGVNFGTYESAINGFATLKETQKQRALLYSEPMPKPKHKLPKKGPVFYSDDVGNWCVPFPGSDKTVVYRTQRYLHDEKKQRPIQFYPYVRMPSLLYTVMMGFISLIFAAFASFGCGRYLLKKFPGFFTFGIISRQGPTQEQIDGTSFTYTFFGRGYDEKLEDSEAQPETAPKKSIRTIVSAPEPAYVTTPICLVQCAYTLLKEANKLPSGGGVYTTGAAFGDTKLIERLTKNNVKFSVVED